MAKTRNDLDRSAAFTILLDVDPQFGSSIEDGGATITSFLEDWHADPSTNMYKFAQGWVNK